MEHNQDRRRHFHRGRRGQDRRGSDRRNQQAQDQPAREGREAREPREGRDGRDTVDVEQIMRDIRARIAQRGGVELSNQQIQELAARRLEAILDPRAAKPALLDELRKSAGMPIQPPPAPAEPAYVFDETTIYESHNGLVRFFRALFKPLLKLLFNPTPIARALNVQARLNVDAAQREAARTQQQAEWNALHYEILQRLVTEVSRVSLDMQSISLKTESLGAKVDFNERRVRGVEGVVHQPRSSGRPVDPQPAAAAATTIDMGPAAEVISSDAPAPGQPVQQPGVPGQPGEGRRRRRRRRGRRGGAQSSDPANVAVMAAGGLAASEEFDDGPDEGEEENGSEATASPTPIDVATAPEPEPQAFVAVPESPAVTAPEPLSVAAPEPEPLPESPSPVPDAPPESDQGPTGHE